MPSRILVTGGCGLIGSALVERALRENASVVVLDNLSTGRREHLPLDPRVELIVGDVCDDALVATLVRRCEAVFHLAAGVGVGLILARPTAALRQSLLGTEAVMRHAAAARRRVFFASTSEVYGDGGTEPLSEERPVGFPAPETLRFTYAAGKTAGEALAFAYAKEYSLPVVAGRFFNVIGRRQSPATGAVVPTFVAQALAGGPLTVHGDGTQTRSFLDVADAAEYVWRLMESAPVGGLLVNIGRDAPITIAALARRIAGMVGAGITVRTGAPSYGEGFFPIQHRRPDVRRLLQATGYAPQVALDETLLDCVTARSLR